MKRSASLVLLLSLTLTPLWAAGCSGGEGDGDLATDTLTRDQKDSLISTMPIPGAGAVGNAMEARDNANARAADHDSIR